MYAWPILFPAQTNREDLVKTVSLFDDDTGDAIDLSGRTLANPGDFTAADWSVTCGDVVTASVSQLTIKDYPIGAELQAVALNVAHDLAIAAGSPVTIADATGLNTMTGFVTSYAPATGALVCQIGCGFVFEIRGSNSSHPDGYGGASDIGQGCDAPLIAASLGSGITIVDVGRVEVRLAKSLITKLRHKTYSAAMTMSDDEETRQLFVGKLPMLSGGVT
jgi:hypothetical protein